MFKRIRASVVAVSVVISLCCVVGASAQTTGPSPAPSPESPMTLAECTAKITQLNSDMERSSVQKLYNPCDSGQYAYGTIVTHYLGCRASKLNAVGGPSYNTYVAESSTTLVVAVSGTTPADGRAPSYCYSGYYTKSINSTFSDTCRRADGLDNVVNTLTVTTASPGATATYEFIPYYAVTGDPTSGVIGYDPKLSYTPAVYTMTTIRNYKDANGLCTPKKDQKRTVSKSTETQGVNIVWPYRDDV